MKVRPQTHASSLDYGPALLLRRDSRSDAQFPELLVLDRAGALVTAMADGGFEYRGRRYWTLSAVAKDITGQHLSGMRFFGLAENKEGK